MNFKDFALSDKTIRAVEELGYTEATDIQAACIPLILDKQDLIGISQTGSGKTAAYGLPALELVDLKINAKYPQVLILTPTRELALQVTDEIQKFSRYNDRIHVVPVYGGQPMNRQIALIRSGCQIVVGTPGRVIDLLNRSILHLSHVRCVVLDEADEMLHMGFREDIETILSGTPEQIQTILFSATMPQAIIDITGQYQKNPAHIKIASKQLTATGVTQSFFEVPRGRKSDALSLLLKYYDPKLAIVFCNTKRMVDEITETLKRQGHMCEALHGDIKQEQRTEIMNRFKNGGFQILVATDVASRGIDVNDIDIVFNYDLPDDCEYYVHRIGRTGRAGKEGRAFTLIESRRQYAALLEIAKRTKSTISALPVPTIEMLREQSAQEALRKIRGFADARDLTDCDAYLTALCTQGMDYHDIAAALFQMYLDKNAALEHMQTMPAAEHFSAPATGRERVSVRKRPRYENEKAKEKFANIPMVRIVISIGRNEKVAPKHILSAAAGASGLPGSIMGAIDIGYDETTIEVPEQYRARILHALNHKVIKGKTITCK